MNSGFGMYSIDGDINTTPLWGQISNLFCPFFDFDQKNCLILCSSNGGFVTKSTNQKSLSRMFAHYSWVKKSLITEILLLDQDKYDGKYCVFNQSSLLFGPFCQNISFYFKVYSWKYFQEYRIDISRWISWK